jgi:hypothetical protein
MSADGYYLFIGGPAHKHWIAVPEGQESVRVPVPPAQPSIWQEGDALYLVPVERLYVVKTMWIFDRMVRVMVVTDLTREEESEALADALLSDDGKRVRQ